MVNVNEHAPLKTTLLREAKPQQLALRRRFVRNPMGVDCVRCHHLVGGATVKRNRSFLRSRNGRVPTVSNTSG